MQIINTQNSLLLSAVAAVVDDVVMTVEKLGMGLSTVLKKGKVVEVTKVVMVRWSDRNIMMYNRDYLRNVRKWSQCEWRVDGLPGGNGNGNGIGHSGEKRVFFLQRNLELASISSRATYILEMKCSKTPIVYCSSTNLNCSPRNP